jgi:hypothetical protein
MGRAYAGCMGCLSLAACIVAGLMSGSHPEIILGRSLLVIVPFSLLGWLVGTAADHALRHSMEMDFRGRVTRWREKINSQEALSGQSR